MHLESTAVSAPGGEADLGRVASAAGARRLRRNEGSQQKDTTALLRGANMRLIQPKPSVSPPHSTEAFSIKTLRAKRERDKASEKARRDHMRDALSRLAKLLAQRCCDSPPDGANEGDGGFDDDADDGAAAAAGGGGAEAAGNANVSSTRSRADTIECAVRYIACLQGHLADVQTRLDQQQARQR